MTYSLMSAERNGADTAAEALFSARCAAAEVARQVCSAAALVWLLMEPTAAWSQGVPADFADPIPRSAANARYGDPAHPDLSGLWRGEQATDFVDLAREALPLTPGYAAKLRETRRLHSIGTPRADPASRCISATMPRFMTTPFEVVQTPGQLTLLSQLHRDMRRIYIDGSGHMPNAEPSYNGNSAGRWEGTTLVVDTVDLREGTLDGFGIPHSDKFRITERFRLIGEGHMEIEFVLADAEAFTRQWVVKRTYRRLPVGTRFEETACDNNRNVDASGHQF